EPQADGNVSEAESSCSAVSGIQTPLFVRVTRRRQIVVPYQLDSSGRKRYPRTASLSKSNRKLDEGDVSEAESCSSVASSVQMPNVARSTRGRQSKKELQLDTDHENTSDAESCSHVEPSITTTRITRSTRKKSQAESTKTEKGNGALSEDVDLIEDAVKSGTITTSDSKPAAELISDTEDASSVAEGNKETSLPDSKHSSKSASTTQRDVKEVVLKDATPVSLRKVKQRAAELPGTKVTKDTGTVGVDDSEEGRGQRREDHSETLVREGKLEPMDRSLTDSLSPKQSLAFRGQKTPSESKKKQECEGADAEADVQRCFSHAGKLRKGEQAGVASSPQEASALAQKADSSGEDQTEENTDSVSRSSGRSGRGDSSVARFLSKDESEESGNSDVADTDTVEENLCCEEAGEKTPSLRKPSKNSSLHAEGLFVIDTAPGMSSSQKYYLDEEGQGSDAESEHKGSEKAEESDLEEAEEELIDEDEKDEDDLLKNKVDVLRLSSSIDPGLNMKKLGGLYISFDAKKQKAASSVIKQLKEKKDKVLQKSVITPDFEKKECVPPFREALHQLKKQRRAEREKTTGDGWFGMRAPEITAELKNDLKVLKMRASLDPKHFYKKNDRDGLPKYFQVGTVVDSPIDFYHSRIPKKQRKRTIVEELLADSEFRRYNKKKYQEIMSEKAAFAAGKRNRKKKKFHN
ncbi:TDIF2 protein, partial [Rhinopomastus cyanomelas]|nr:TDIF2 protein [Rhinopomastus cyanomelas]